MIRDDELKSSLDYSEGMKEAAHRVLIELINLFEAYRDDIRIVGGWVPDLMFPGEPYFASVLCFFSCIIFKIFDFSMNLGSQSAAWFPSPKGRGHAMST